MALQNGLTMADMEHMTVGMLVDFAITRSNRNIGKNDEVYATQADINAF